MTDVPPLLTKCCTKCGEWKPLSRYSLHTKASGKLRSVCKDCAYAADVALYGPLRKLRKEAAAKARQDYIDCPTKRCRCCEEVKDKTQFTHSSKSVDGYMSECKVCREVARKEWRKTEYARASGILRCREYSQRIKQRPDLAARRYRSHRVQQLKSQIARETCERLGIDLTKLAKEQYDAEQREKHARTENLQQGERASAGDPEAANGRPGNQAGRRRSRSAGVVPATGE